MAPRQVAAGGGDAEGLLPSSSHPSAFAANSASETIVGISGLSPSASPSREHSTPLTPRRASAMLRGAASAAAAPTRQAITTVLSSWVSRRFLGGLAVILPIAISAFATIKILNFFDHLFAPLLEALLGFRVVGLGFATSMLFIFATGVVASSYVGGALISLGEWVIRRLPLVKHVFSAAKQISAAISPGGVEGENGVGGSFRECVLVKNPRLGNYMLVRSRKERKKEKKEGRKKEKKDRKERESGFFSKFLEVLCSFFLFFSSFRSFLLSFFLRERERERERHAERETEQKEAHPRNSRPSETFQKKKTGLCHGRD